MHVSRIPRSFVRSFGHSFAAVALTTSVGLLSTGCISQEKYDAQRLRGNGLEDQLARAETDAKTARAQAAAWKTQLDSINQGSNGMSGLVANQTQQISTLQSQLADITAKYNEAINNIGKGAPLDPVLTNELTAFADQNPGLVEFDAKKGTVKFKSDLTFNSGDAALQPSAQTAIDKFAAILKSPAAAGYELMVCGHADNQKVSAGTMSRGHKDNWYLSSHRALTVAEALQKQGVDSKRIGAVGYGEYRPVASNDSKAGMAMNRRVEVLILPQQIADSPPVNAPVNASPAAEKPKIEVNDGLNK